MLNKLQILKCQQCGLVLEVLDAAECNVECCGSPLEVLAVKTAAEEGKEKHVPVIERTDSGVKVKVGSVPHPMEDKHYIQWIEILADGKSYRQFLEPGNAPEATFEIPAEKFTVRELCNIHGLWKAGG